MDVGLFDFTLPDDRIALRPAVPRDAARMLVVPGDPAQPFLDRGVGDLAAFLEPGDALVVNDTRVIAAELHGIRERGENRAGVHVNLLRTMGAGGWLALLRPAKKVRNGDILAFERDKDILRARVTDRQDGGVTCLQFDREDDALARALDRHGTTPLPPYISTRRAVTAEDASNYQTMFANQAGAVAAPTAGLHFTPRLLDAIRQRGVSVHTVTLHVGGATFLPVKAGRTEDHVMHAEWGALSAETARALNGVRAANGRIVATGTTSLRILESACDSDGRIHPFASDTDIFITPGYAFGCVDVLLTNFHLPRSTLFMLVCAFSGLARMKAAYAHAISAPYRFYSYGDACLLFRAGGAT